MKYMSVKKFLVMLLLAFTLVPTTLAQQSSMTDRQVMEFIIKENERGTSRDKIVTKLIEKGVPISQIRRLEQKYKRERNNSNLGARDLSGSSSGNESRLRQSNGDRRGGQGGEAGAAGYENRVRDERTFQRRGDVNDDPYDVDLSSLSEQQRARLLEQRREEYSDALDFIVPDSIDLYLDGFEEDKKDKTRKVFGRDIFNKRMLSFEPNMNIATPAGYVLGPGDAVNIDIWGASQRSEELTVTPDGTVNVEGYGPIHVAGMTVEAANSRLRSTLGSRFAGSQIRLTVGQTKTISVNVIGEVKVPGTYTLSAFATVFHALYMAGGINEIGTLRDIKVYRKGKLITSVDIYDYILNGKLSGNVHLASDDVIIVGPYDCLVDVSGKVKRPMFYEMKRTESVATLIGYAGGFAGDAYQGSVRLIRKSEGQMAIYSLDEFERASFQLTDGDSLYVDSVLTRYRNMVEVKGAVFRPGMYQMDGGITTVRQLVESAGGLTEDALKNRAVMHRRRADRTLEVLAIDLKGVMEHTIPDVALQNEDVLFVPGLSEMQGERTLTIDGEVYYPGIYEYAENTTLEDLVLQAGGLKDAASIVKVDVARRIRNNTALTASDQVAQYYSFSLKEGFVVDGTPGFVLEPFDEVYVRRSPGYSEQEHVTIEGEVSFTGTYVITNKGLRLSDLIRNAGGLTDQAYPRGARLERRLTAAEKLKQQSLLRLVTAGDSVDMRKLELGDTRYVGINLDKALENPGSDEWDIVLQKGDRIIVPQYNNTVTINGEVMYPNTVAFCAGEDLKFYINQAGGYGMNAKKSRVFAVNMNGTVTRIRSAKDIQPGCEIVVPAKPKRKGMSFSEILGLGTVTASLATVVATLVK